MYHHLFFSIHHYTTLHSLSGERYLFFAHVHNTFWTYILDLGLDTIVFAYIIIPGDATSPACIGLTSKVYTHVCAYCGYQHLYCDSLTKCHDLKKIYYIILTTCESKDHIFPTGVIEVIETECILVLSSTTNCARHIKKMKITLIILHVRHGSARSTEAT